MVFDTMVEISKIAYLQASKRTIKKVLRLHNQTFLHAMWCKELIGKSPKVLTRRKFYGRYWHSLTTHAPIVYRIISLSSIHTEEEERTFSQINSIANGTSSRRHDEIITPSLVRIQAEQKEKEKRKTTFQKQNSKVSKFSSVIPEFPNSVIPHRFLLKYPREYQAHLERISDFLFCGENVWWRRNLGGIEFLDGESEEDSKPGAGPFLHHFRYMNIKTEQSFLKAKWQQCLDENVIIPHIVITYRDEVTNQEITVPTNFFNEGNDEDDEDDEDDGTDGDEDKVNNDSNIEVEEEDNDDNNTEYPEEIEIGFQFDGDDTVDSDDETEISDYQQTLLDDYQSHYQDATEEPPNSIPDSLAEKPDSTSHLTLNNQQTSCTSSNISGEPHISTCTDDTSADSSVPQISGSITSIDSNFPTLSIASVSENAPKEENSLQTELARNVSKVISDYYLLQQLDKARMKWKNSASLKVKATSATSYQTKILHGNYLSVLAKVQTKVLAQHDPLKNQLKEWEDNYFLENGKEPQHMDIQSNQDIHSIYKKFNLCKQLLSHWNISLHLK